MSKMCDRLWKNIVANTKLTDFIALGGKQLYLSRTRIRCILNTEIESGSSKIKNLNAIDS
jgi:hypothetical protein